MIRNTHAAASARHGRRLHRQRRGHRRRRASRASIPRDDGDYALSPTSSRTSLMKVETHNHPTAISPFPGRGHRLGRRDPRRGRDRARREAQGGADRLHASRTCASRASSSRGKRDGIGKPGAHRLRARDHARRPDRRRRLQQRVRPAQPRGLLPHLRAARSAGEVRGYHKPIMIAGGLGNIAARARRTSSRFAPGALLVQLGGPAMLIGLGGGAASSMATGANTEDLDFASVQRDNAEIQRRAQEVIDRCWALGERNPILSIHDVGAGGLSNALPELVHGGGRGGAVRPARDPERRAGHVAAGDLVQRGAGALRARDRARRSRALSRRSASASAARSRSSARRPTTAGSSSTTRISATSPVDMALAVLLGKPPRMTRDVTRVRARAAAARTRAASICARRPTACCGCRRSPTRRS